MHCAPVGQGWPVGISFHHVVLCARAQPLHFLLPPISLTLRAIHPCVHLLTHNTPVSTVTYCWTRFPSFLPSVYMFTHIYAYRSQGTTSGVNQMPPWPWDYIMCQAFTWALRTNPRCSDNLLISSARWIMSQKHQITISLLSSLMFFLSLCRLGYLTSILFFFSGNFI